MCLYVFGGSLGVVDKELFSSPLKLHGIDGRDSLSTALHLGNVALTHKFWKLPEKCLDWCDKLWERGSEPNMESLRGGTGGGTPLGGISGASEILVKPSSLIDDSRLFFLRGGNGGGCKGPSRGDKSINGSACCDRFVQLSEPMLTVRNTLSPLCGDRGVVGVDGVVLCGDDDSVSLSSSLRMDPNGALNENDPTFCVEDCFAVTGLIPGDFNG